LHDIFTAAGAADAFTSCSPERAGARAESAKKWTVEELRGARTRKIAANFSSDRDLRSSLGLADVKAGRG
jgi:hypothetical protein